MYQDETSKKKLINIQWNKLKSFLVIKCINIYL